MFWKKRNGIGVDLGTVNTLVYAEGRGIVVNEPSLVSINRKTRRIVAVGSKAREMLGKTPPHIDTVQPIMDGVIYDYDVARELLQHLFSLAYMASRVRPERAVIGVPTAVSDVEIRAVLSAAKEAGIHEAWVIQEPVAAAIGNKLPVLEPVGTMVIDIGGGTTDIAVISLGNIVASRSLKVGGESFDRDIADFVRTKKKVLLGKKTVIEAKHQVATLVEGDSPAEITLRGRDLGSGLPQEVILTDADIREAIKKSVAQILKTVRQLVEEIEPELIGDILQRGVFLTGGGAMIEGLRELLEEYVKIPVHLVDDPLGSVAKGAGIVVENVEKFRNLIYHDGGEGKEGK